MRITIDPVTRLAGGLRVSVELEDGAVKSAASSGLVYRGFEQMLLDKDPMDAPYFSQRICGMCPAPQATAAVEAIESAAGVTGSVPKDALLARNILNGLGWMKSHVAHLYLGFLPDLADPVYGDALNASSLGNLLWEELKVRYTAGEGSAYAGALQCIKTIGRAEGILGGRSPGSPAIVPGGVTSRPSGGDIAALEQCLADMDGFLRERMLGALSIDEWLAGTHDQDRGFAFDYVERLPLGGLAPGKGWGDLPLFLMFGSRMFANDTLSLPAYIGLDAMGGYPLDDQLIGFLSYGAFYRIENGQDGYATLEENGPAEIAAGFTPGSMRNIYGPADRPDPNLIVEHVAASFYDHGDEKASEMPLNGETRPLAKPFDIGYDGARYSFIKAPRYGRVPCEVGPLARQINAREALIIDIMRRLYARNARVNNYTSAINYPLASIYTRTVARMQETLLLSRLLHGWIGGLEIADNGRRYSVPLSLKPGRTGSGLVEAPRGALGHWLRLNKYGRIENYQVVAPSTWNASPKCSEQIGGPIEQALLGCSTTPSGYLPGSETDPVGIYHVIRSFDPCAACAVHTVRRRDDG